MLLSLSLEHLQRSCLSCNYTDPNQPSFAFEPRIFTPDSISATDMRCLSSVSVFLQVDCHKNGENANVFRIYVGSSGEVKVSSTSPCQGTNVTKQSEMSTSNTPFDRPSNASPSHPNRVGNPNATGTGIGSLDSVQQQLTIEGFLNPSEFLPPNATTFPDSFGAVLAGRSKLTLPSQSASSSLSSAEVPEACTLSSDAVVLSNSDNTKNTRNDQLGELAGTTRAPGFSGTSLPNRTNNSLETQWKDTAAQLHALFGLERDMMDCTEMQTFNDADLAVLLGMPTEDVGPESTAEQLNERFDATMETIVPILDPVAEHHGHQNLSEENMGEAQTPTVEATPRNPPIPSSSEGTTLVALSPSNSSPSSSNAGDKQPRKTQSKCAGFQLNPRRIGLSGRRRSAAHGDSKNGRQFPCKVCEDTFTRKHDRLRHELRQHGMVSEWGCPQCQKVFSSAKRLGLHSCVVESMRMSPKV